MKRRILIGLALLSTVVVRAGLIWFNFVREEMINQVFATVKPPAQIVSTAIAETRTWTSGITAIGMATAKREATGRPGERHRKGDVLRS